MITANTLKQLHILMQNCTDGSAEKVIMYNVANGLDAWRKLYHDQLPEVEHQKQMLLNEFHHFTKAAGLKDMRDRIQDLERITALWSQVADAPFDEESKLSKLRAIVPGEVYKYIALEARKVTRYDELVQLIEAQTMDPITGIMRGDKVPGLSNVHKEDPGEEQQASQGFEDMLSHWGVDPDTDAGQVIINALNGKGKGPGKGGKGKGKTCWNCGQTGHFA